MGKNMPRKLSLNKTSLNPKQTEIFASKKSAVEISPETINLHATQPILSRNQQLQKKFLKVATLYTMQRPSQAFEESPINNNKKIMKGANSQTSLLVESEQSSTNQGINNNENPAAQVNRIANVMRRPVLKIGGTLLKHGASGTEGDLIVPRKPIRTTSKDNKDKDHTSEHGVFLIKSKSKIPNPPPPPAPANISNSTLTGSELKPEKSERSNKEEKDEGLKEKLAKLRKRTRTVIERYKIREKLLVNENKRLKEQVKDLKNALTKYESIF